MEALSSFKDHPFSEAERLWLETAALEPHFDARGARARLYERLPKEFRPHLIDSRFYSNDRLTHLGVRLFRAEDEIFKVIEDLVSALKSRILSEPTIDSLSVREMAEVTHYSELQVRDALVFLRDYGSLSMGLTFGKGGEINGVLFAGSRGYDDVLQFPGVDALLQQWYEVRRQQSDFRVVFGKRGDPISSTTPEPKALAVKRDTAFVIMPIDPSNPELEDVLGAIKEICKIFGVKAYRADEIEHQDLITNVILNEIRECDILIADLSHERPNVYYEIGYAHALNKKPILYRRQGTRLHFDLSVHNVPEYKNLTELRSLLRRRLEAILGRVPHDA